MLEEKDGSKDKNYVQATCCVWPHWVSFHSPFFSSCSSCLTPPVGGRVMRTWSFCTSSELTSCVQSFDWSNYPSLSFTDSAFFQCYIFCLAFLWPSELFIRPVLLSIRRWIITLDKKDTDKLLVISLFAWPLLDVLSDSYYMAHNYVISRPDEREECDIIWSAEVGPSSEKSQPIIKAQLHL